MASGQAMGQQAIALDEKQVQAPRLETKRWRRQKPFSQPTEPIAVVDASNLSKDDLVSAGSIGHEKGECKPCAFLYTKGCKSGKDCQFCHVCGPDEKKNRQKAKRMQFQQLRKEAEPSSDDAQSMVCAATLDDECTIESSQGTDVVVDPVIDVLEPTELNSSKLTLPSFCTWRPSCLQIPDEHLDAPYVVRNTFIEASGSSSSLLSSSCGDRAVSSCPASRIGEMVLDEQTRCDDADTLSIDDMTTLSLDSPQSLSGVAWPSTPDAPAKSDHKMLTPALTNLSAVQSHLAFAVKNTFIDVSTTLDTLYEEDAACSRSISSCPAHRIGQIELTEASLFEDAMGEWSTAQGICHSIWPVTPEPPAMYESLLPVSCFDSHADFMMMPAAPTPLYPFPQELPAMLPTLAIQADIQSHSSVSDVRVLSLVDMLDDTSCSKVACEPCEQTPPDALPSMGSALHSTGTCKPCGFFHKNGCMAGVQCDFCHLCDSGEKKRRQKEKREMYRESARMGRSAASGGA